MADDNVGTEVVETVSKIATIGADFLKSLIGKTVDEARKLVHDSGLEAREIRPEDYTTMDFVPDRVNLRIKDGIVDNADVG